MKKIPITKDCYYCLTKEGEMHPFYKKKVVLTPVKVAGVDRKICQYCVERNNNKTS